MPSNVYMLGYFGDHAEGVVKILCESKFLVYNPAVETEEPKTPEAVHLDNLEAMQRADVFLVSVDEVDTPYKLMNTCLTMAEHGPKKSVRTYEILRKRIDGMASATSNTTLAWTCGWAYASGKILVTFSMTDIAPPMPQSLVAHVISLPRLEEVATALSKLSGDGVQQATALNEIRGKHSLQQAS